MNHLYTREGKPLRLRGDNVFDRSGRQLGTKIYGPDAGTIVGDRVVYRSTDSASVSSPFAPRARSGSATADRAASAIWGDEPLE